MFVTWNHLQTCEQTSHRQPFKIPYKDPPIISNIHSMHIINYHVIKITSLKSIVGHVDFKLSIPYTNIFKSR